jgi:hypothetical protein
MEDERPARGPKIVPVSRITPLRLAALMWRFDLGEKQNAGTVSSIERRKTLLFHCFHY